MNKDRILSHQFSQKLSLAELDKVSAAGMTSSITGHASYGGAWDAVVDVTIDA